MRPPLGLLSISLMSLALFAVTTAAVMARASVRLDAAIQGWVQAIPLGPFRLLTGVANSLGERRQLALGAVSVVVVLLLSHRDGLAMIAASAVGGLGQLVKAVVEQPCPSDADELAAGELGRCHSYPSGHVIFSTWLGVMVYAAVAHRLPARLRVVAAAMAGALVVTMSVARIDAGVHWPSDVAGGVLLGLGWCALVLAAARKWAAPTRQTIG